MKLHTKKFLLSFFVIAAFAVYAAYQRNINGGFNPADPYPDLGGTQAPSALDTPTPSAIARRLPVSTSLPASPKPSALPPTPKPSTPTPTPKSMYNDGQFTGNSADAYYGNVQVMATIQGGKITNIQFLDYPQDRSHSVQINNYAMPILKTEAIQAQSAQVDTVSGATDTSYAFIDSLSSALSQARN